MRFLSSIKTHSELYYTGTCIPSEHGIMYTAYHKLVKSFSPFVTGQMPLPNIISSKRQQSVDLLQLLYIPHMQAM